MIIFKRGNDVLIIIFKTKMYVGGGKVVNGPYFYGGRAIHIKVLPFLVQGHFQAPNMIYTDRGL